MNINEIIVIKKILIRLYVFVFGLWIGRIVCIGIDIGWIVLW